MGQFKPMVKMETTEPSVILKLKKGGHVNMKKGGKAEAGHKKMAMGGGAMEMMAGTPALVGRPAVNAPVRAPGKPSMASRRKAMMAKKPSIPMSNPAMPAEAMPPMKKGGMAKGGDMPQDKAMIKKAFKQHDMQEHKGGKGTSLKLKKGGMKTGGVTDGQGGYKTGGVAMGNAGGFKSGGMSMVEKGGEMVPDFAADGKGKMKMGGMMGGGGMHMMPNGSMMKNSAMKKGGMATGGVKMGNAGGFKHGGKSSKKAYATGGTVNSGKPVAMPQGAKKPTPPVSTNRVSGTFKSGGKVTPAEGRLRANNQAENSTAMKQAKAQSNDIYSKYQKMKDGGDTSDKKMDMSKGAYDAHYANEKAENESMRDMVLGVPKKLFEGVKGMFSPKVPEGQGAVTKTEKSITVSPAGKKRGGVAC